MSVATMSTTGAAADSPAASLPGQQHRLRVSPRAGSHPELQVVLYDSGTPLVEEAPPLLLVHSVNATASAFEMEPVFLRQGRRRRVVAIDLPGFGSADKPDIAYTPTLMRDAIVAAIDWVGAPAIDLMALSLGGEFATEAALRRPGRVRSLALISPTGMEARREHERYAAGRTRANATAQRVLRGSAVGRGLYRLLTSRAPMHWYLGRAWGAGAIDPRLLEHGRRLATLPGAERAPLDFVSGALFTRGVIERYRMLALPVWVCHGRQGPFSDVGACPHRTGSAAMGGSHPVRRAIFDTGALPHFSMPTPFDDAYLRFLDGLAGAGRGKPRATGRAAAAAALSAS
jgi:pimeloyl-ACP methyl ester carboxylesterase